MPMNLLTGKEAPRTYVTWNALTTQAQAALKPVQQWLNESDIPMPFLDVQAIDGYIESFNDAHGESNHTELIIIRELLAEQELDILWMDFAGD